jgi:hypothetical protein
VSRSAPECALVSDPPADSLTFQIALVEMRK